MATGVVRKQWRLEQRQLRRIGRGVAPFADRVADHLRHLDARDRDVVILVAWCDLEPAAVAMALDLPVGTVAARLHGLAQQLLERAQARPSGVPSSRPGSVVVDGLDLVRALRPAGSDLGPDLLEAVRHDLQVATGQPLAGAPRPTSAVAAEHEQLRRWRASPGAVVATLRARGSSST